MKKDELSTLLRGRNLPYSGNKETLVRRLEEDDSKEPLVDVSEGPSAKEASATKTAANEFEYWTLCRPREDIQAEKRATDKDCDSEEEEIEGFWEEGGPRDESAQHNEAKATSQTEQRKSICGQKKGYLMAARLQYEVAIRDQDAIGKHFYNDFNGYGFQELLAFNSEYSKKTVKPAGLWACIEAWAWILNEKSIWFHVDDPETVLDTLRIIGGAIFTTLNVLEKHDLLLPFCYWPGDYEDQLAWRGAMIQEAKSHGIVFKDAPYTISTRLEEDGLSGPQNGKGYSKWKNFNWVKEFTSFHRKHRKGSGPGATIGGRQYALETREDRRGARENFDFWGLVSDSEWSDCSDDEDGGILVRDGE